MYMQLSCQAIKTELMTDLVKKCQFLKDRTQPKLWFVNLWIEFNLNNDEEDRICFVVRY